jgi:hypothetical protein
MEILLSIALLAMADPSIATQATLLDAGYQQMYNLEFGAAHQSFHEWSRQHPADPLGPVSDAAAYLFSEFDRLHILQSEFFVHDDAFVAHVAHQKLTPDPVLKQNFENALDQSGQLSDRALGSEPLNRNALFAALLRLGLHADYLALVEKRYVASLSEVKTGRAMAEKLIALDPGYSDAYLAVGVENYLLSLKPAPIRWLLRASGAETDKDRGIENLALTAEKGHYLMPYAKILLAVAALRDKNTARAKELLEGLVREFPRNQLYAQELSRLR